MGRHRRGIRQLDDAARGDLPPAARYPRGMGHGGQRPGHGVRQYGRGLRHRRGLHPRPLDRRERLLRRISGQRPGRGRGRRHPHAAASDDCRQRRQRLRPAGDGRGHAGGVRPAGRYPRQAGSPLPRHAGHRVHGPEGQAVDAANPQRQAHHPGRPEDRGGNGGQRPDRPADRGQPDRAQRAGPATAPDPGPRRRAPGHRQRACLLRRARHRARRRSRRTRPRRRRPGANASSWCAPKPAPRTSTACMPPRAFSPRAAA